MRYRLSLALPGRNKVLELQLSESETRFILLTALALIEVHSIYRGNVWT